MELELHRNCCPRSLISSCRVVAPWTVQRADSELACLSYNGSFECTEARSVPRAPDPAKDPRLKSVCRVSPLRRQPASRNPEPTINPKRILVVDDNADAANSLVELLRLDGHEADAVYSANGALNAVETNNPDVVLLDIGLPEMDGYQVAQQIRKSSSGIRLIALTGYGQAEDIARTRAAGFDAHMVKPVDFDVLQRAIAAIDSGKRAEPETSGLRHA